MLSNIQVSLLLFWVSYFESPWFFPSYKTGTVKWRITLVLTRPVSFGIWWKSIPINISLPSLCLYCLWQSFLNFSKLTIDFKMLLIYILCSGICNPSVFTQWKKMKNCKICVSMYNCHKASDESLFQKIHSIKA